MYQRSGEYLQLKFDFTYTDSFRLSFRQCEKILPHMIYRHMTSRFHHRPCRKVVTIVHYLLVQLRSDRCRMLLFRQHVRWRLKRNIDVMEKTMIPCTVRATRIWPTMTMSITIRKLAKHCYVISLLKSYHRVRHLFSTEEKNFSVTTMSIFSSQSSVLEWGRRRWRWSYQ